MSPHALGAFGVLRAAILAGLMIPSLAAGVAAQTAPAPAAQAVRTSLPFTIGFDLAVQPGPYTGRVYIVLSSPGRGEPRSAILNWFDPPQVVARDVRNIGPDQTITLGASDLAFPHAAVEIPAGEYTVQAIARRSLDSPVPGQGPGDLFSTPVRINYPPAPDKIVELRLSEVAKPKPFAETDRVRLVEINSPSLSAFHGREVKIRAGVLLPEGWTDSGAASYPVVYWITGFGGDHRGIARLKGLIADPPGAGGARAILVAPDPTCGTGHCVFADSANNGPWGKALVEELIPAVESRFHGAGPSRRYVSGISSGGWSSLWLQVAYPDAFGGCWSHCPDPVDFRDFQRIDLYAPNANMYTDEGGGRRPIARGGPDGSTPMGWYEPFCRMERVLGRGGQIGSFEAVFSPRGADGGPAPLFDWETGAVDPAVAKAWERYDIRLVLERNWAVLGPKLKGKLHIYAGERDTFYLEGAAERLKESLEKLGSDAEVTIIPGMPHTVHRPGVEAMMRTIAAGSGS